MIRHNDFDLSKITTFHLPARADTYVEYCSVDELCDALRESRDRAIYHIGGGSNLLFTKDFDGVILHSAMKGISVVAEHDDGTVSVEVQSGTIWDNFVAWTVEHNLYGVENLSAIPGEAGASAIQNIGAYGVEAKDVIENVNLFDIASHSQLTMTTDKLGYSYRHSIFKTKEYAGRYIALSVTFRLSRKPEFTLSYGPLRQLANTGTLTLRKLRDYIVNIRTSKLPDPNQLGNAGSFFKNPCITKEHFQQLQLQYPDIPGYPLPDGYIKVPAGWLIEHAGLKGHTVGDAMVYPDQCLVLVNKGHAVPADVIELCRQVQEKITHTYQIKINPEVIFV